LKLGDYDPSSNTIFLVLPALQVSTERAMQLLQSGLQLPSAWKRKLSD
jgi:hypothetical protein